MCREESVAAFEHLGRAGDSALREFGADHTIARCFARMYALDLGAFVEVLADACRETAGQAQCVQSLRRVQFQQIRHGRCGAEHTGERRVVIAAPRRFGMHRGGNPAHDVVAAHDRRHDVLCAARTLLCCRHHRRKDYARRMRGTLRVAIVEIEPVHVGAGDQRRIGRGQFRTAADDARGTRGVALFESMRAMPATQASLRQRSRRSGSRAIVRLYACIVSGGQWLKVSLAACAASRALTPMLMSSVVVSMFILFALMFGWFAVALTVVPRRFAHYQAIDRDHAPALSARTINGLISASAIPGGRYRQPAATTRESREPMQRSHHAAGCDSRAGLQFGDFSDHFLRGFETDRREPHAETVLQFRHDAAEPEQYRRPDFGIVADNL